MNLLQFYLQTRHSLEAPCLTRNGGICNYSKLFVKLFLHTFVDLEQGAWVLRKQPREPNFTVFLGETSFRHPLLCKLYNCFLKLCLFSFYSGPSTKEEMGDLKSPSASPFTGKDITVLAGKLKHMALNTPLRFSAQALRPHSKNSARFGCLSHHSFFSRHNPHPHRVTHIQGKHTAVPSCTFRSKVQACFC